MISKEEGDFKQNVNETSVSYTLGEVSVKHPCKVLLGLMIHPGTYWVTSFCEEVNVG